MNIERAHRACNVQMVLNVAGITTDDLIDQLLLRRRLLKLDSSAAFYNELADDAGYMESCNRSIVRGIATGLNNKLILQWNDHAGPPNERGEAYQTERRAVVTVLVSEALARELEGE